MHKICALQVKQPLLKAVLFLLLSCFQNSASYAQQGWEEEAFRAMSDAERFRFVHDQPFGEMDSAALTKALAAMLEIAGEKRDHRSSLALKYHKFQARRILKPTPEATLESLSELEKEGKAQGFEVEEIVAHHFAVFEQYNLKNMRHEQLYVEILREFERMKGLGFEKFRDYNVARMLYHSGKFMYELEDFEKALQFFSTAEQFIETEGRNMHTAFLVLNYIQSIYQSRKEYDKGIGYAKKILQLAQGARSESDLQRRWCKEWQGIASIDIASMLVGQRKFAEGETFATKGYELVKATDESGYQTEYDALLVLAPTKLELGKMEEAAALLQRLNLIYEAVRQQEYFYFKNLRYFETASKYHEMKGDYGEAMRFAHLGEPIRDSLERRNDARKLEKINQRLEAEKYTQQLQLVESEKQLQKWLRNAALAILALVVALGYANYRRLQARRRLDLAELENARKDLEEFTHNFKEKSELAENLRLEMEKLSARGERSQYLEQLNSSTILTDEDWTKFRSVFEKVYPDFIADQKTLHPDLTQAELRYLVLEKLQLSTHEMANMLGVSDGTIRQTRMRLKKKIGEG